MKLYHGSNVEIDRIDFTRSKVGKDFGIGFYLSADLKQAQDMALKKTDLLGCGRPTVTEFDFDESCLISGALRVLEFASYDNDWAEFVLNNRKNRTREQIHGYDIVVGPIANDAVGYQIRRFTSGIIDKEHFIEELKYMKGISIQYFFGTAKAIEYLTKL